MGITRNELSNKLSLEIPISVDGIQSKTTPNLYNITTKRISAYMDGLSICVKFDSDSTDYISINIDNLGTRQVVDCYSDRVFDIKKNAILNLKYNASTGNFMILGKGGGLSSEQKQILVDIVNSEIQDVGNAKGMLSSVLGSPITPEDPWREIESDIKNIKNKLATNLSNKRITASGNESLDSLASKVNNILLGQGNAVEADVLKGKTFTNSDGILRTGNIDLSNLKPENIKNGININGVTGNLQPLFNDWGTWGDTPMGGFVSKTSNNEIVQIYTETFEAGGYGPGITTSHCYIYDINRNLLSHNTFNIEGTGYYTFRLCINYANMLTKDLALVTGYQNYRDDGETYTYSQSFLYNIRTNRVIYPSDYRLIGCINVGEYGYVYSHPSYNENSIYKYDNYGNILKTISINYDVGGKGIYNVGDYILFIYAPGTASYSMLNVYDKDLNLIKSNNISTMYTFYNHVAPIDNNKIFVYYAYSWSSSMYKYLQIIDILTGNVLYSTDLMKTAYASYDIEKVYISDYIYVTLVKYISVVGINETIKLILAFDKTNLNLVKRVPYYLYDKDFKYYIDETNHIKYV